jgi:SNF2 family DNA or RNA helicase
MNNSFRQHTGCQDIILDTSSPKMDVHSNIRLFPHQQALVAKMIEMESSRHKETLIGVLKDPPGSGKSFALLALMLYEKRQFGRTQNLLVIPHNIHKQWLKYIEDFSNELNATSLMYYGDVTSLFYDSRILFEYDIIITTSTFYDMITSTVTSIGAWFSRVIFDEIDSISFFTKAQIPSQSVWLVSASAELTKSGVYMEYAKRNGIICDPLFIKRSINLPPTIIEHHNCHNEYVDILQTGDILDKEKMKSVHAVDFSPFKFEYLPNEDAISNPKQLLSALFRDNCLALHSTIDLIKTLEKGATYQSYLPEIFGKKINKKNALEKSIAKILSVLARSKCAICCDDYLPPSTVVPRLRAVTKCCGTLFHKDCIISWLKKIPRCPKCCIEYVNKNKSDNSKNDNNNNDNSNNDKDNDNLLPDFEPVKAGSISNISQDKMDEFGNILDKECARDNFRILIFSDMSGTFLKVIQVLKKKELDYTEIEGNQYTMDRAMNEYKSGKKPILLVDAQSYGAGMNMEMTTAVIIMHKTERESQIIGRAQRLGRTDQLHVHHLIYNNEI